MYLPPVVSASEWQVAHEALLAKEKELTRALDALAAERRRQPMVKIGSDYRFTGPAGSANPEQVRLVDLFEGRRQLLIYHFMLGPADEACSGCSAVVDNIGDLTHLHQRDTNMVLVSLAPLPEIEAYQRRMGWAVPWYSSYGSSFNRDFGRTTDDGEMFGLSAFLRDGDDVYRTYFTTSRGVDRLRLDFNLLDLTAFGRQETWEDSPAGVPQTAPYEWWRRHDEYGPEPAGAPQG